MMEPANEKLLKEFGFKAHEIEVGKDQVMLVNWPNPVKCYRLIHEAWNHSIEESYYWILNYLRTDLGYLVHKVTDVFSASEQSSFFGLGQQRLGMQQDKVSNFLAIIGKMTKELFQLVRELRIIDERLIFYYDSEKRAKDVYAVKDTGAASKSWESAEITLKGYWVDLVEQGSKNPASVYGMAREVQFTTLPDLFFSIHPFDEEHVDQIVEGEELRNAFNRKVREVLKRKLMTYLVWKKQTKRELLDKRGFTLRYMYQHVHIIKLYMTYVKPYLKNVQRLQLDEQMAESPDLVAAFESSMIEVEIMGQFLPMENKKYWDVLAIHFTFRTKPSLNYNAEGYNRGPIHEGLVEITYRTYTWTQKQIDAYKKMRDKEDFLLLKIIDKNLDFALAELGDEFFRYLNEAEEMMQKKYTDDKYVPFHDLIGVEDPNKKKKMEEEAAKMKKQRSNNPFASIVDGFSELGAAFGGNSKKKADSKKKSGEIVLNSLQESTEKSNCSASSSIKSWLSYKNYKKAHKMIAW
ncbi:hypothetical protein H6503_04625 [Candidatus Woesearchaeota archaeon]|nr:hypothetical protein [Candidatus Woesearchaeota archaeon]